MTLTPAPAPAPVFMLMLVLGGCSEGGPVEVDPLDAELIRELSMAQGDHAGSDHGGAWSLELEPGECDCPSVDLDGAPVSLCELGALSVAEPIVVEIVEGSGVLAIPTGPDAPFGVLTGAVWADGSFDVAARHDATTLVGPLEVLTRLDGQFSEDGAVASGWAGQRLIGDILGEAVDCRQIGTFFGARS